MSLSPLVEIGLCFIHHTFSPLLYFIWLPPKSLISTLSLENLEEVHRYSEVLHWDGLYQHIRWILLCTNLHQIDHLVIYDPLTYLIIPHNDVLRPFMIHVILSKMNNTLTRSEPKLNPL